MPGTKRDAKPISASDLTSFIKEHSDFSFEMRVRQIFHSKKQRIQHGGTYVDPHTALPRQFDLRVELNKKSWHLPSRVLLAVECKNLSSFAPMLVSRCRRTASEAGHDVWVTTCGDYDRVVSETRANPTIMTKAVSSSTLPSTVTLSVPPYVSRYPSGEMVGKSIDCVSRKGNDELKGGDSEIYNKWSQALQSASEMIQHQSEGHENLGTSLCIHAIIPILVIPDGRLFAIDYEDDGSIAEGVRSVDSTPFYVDYASSSMPKFGRKFKFKNLEIMTESYLNRFSGEFSGDGHSELLHDFIPPDECWGELLRSSE